MCLWGKLFNNKQTSLCEGQASQTSFCPECNRQVFLKPWQKESAFVSNPRVPFRPLHAELPEETLIPFSSEYLDLRNSIIEWLEIICSQFGFQSETFFVALKIIDKVFSSFSVHIEDRNIVILMSLYLASKFQEQDKKMFRLKQFQEQLGESYSQEQLV